MIETLLARTRGLFQTDATAVESIEPDDEAEPESVSTELFACERCDRTYVSEAMDACPRCDDGVERVPNKHDLGIA